jgi:hypothetical protein
MPSSLVSNYIGRTVYTFGRNAAVAATRELIYSASQDIDFAAVMGAGFTLDISATSSADRNGGTGAQLITITGLGEAFELQWETIAPPSSQVLYATTTKKFTRVFAAEVTQAGTGKQNAGTIYVIKNGTSAVPAAGIPPTLTSAMLIMAAGTNADASAYFTVPAESSYALSNIVITNRSQIATFYVYVENAAGLKKVWGQYEIPATGLPFIIDKQMLGNLILTEREEISIRAVAATTGAVATASMVLTKIR